MTNLSFADWQATGVLHDDLGEHLDDADLQGTPGRIYEGMYFSELLPHHPHGRWYTILGGGCFQSDELSEVEEALYDWLAEPGPRRYEPGPYVLVGSLANQGHGDGSAVAFQNFDVEHSDVDDCGSLRPEICTRIATETYWDSNLVWSLHRRLM